MKSRTREKDAKTERLRADYQGAFHEWALQVSRLQAAGGSTPGSFVRKEAEDRVAAAETAYRDTRDRLTEDMTEEMVDSPPDLRL